MVQLSGLPLEPRCPDNRGSTVYISTSYLLYIIIVLYKVTFAATVGGLQSGASDSLSTGAAISAIFLGVITLCISIICFCTHFLNFKNPVRCCPQVSLLTLMFVATLITNTVFCVLFVVQNINKPAGLGSSAEVAQLAVMSLSWILLPMFWVFCLCSANTCWSKRNSAANM